jgi:hypothetical protein
MDEGNRYDTPSTVDRIAGHNARWDAICAVK